MYIYEAPGFLLSHEATSAQRHYMWQAGLRGGAEGEEWCDVLFHHVGTHWCGCAAKWRGLAGRALASTSYTKGKKMYLGPLGTPLIL